MAPKGTKGLKSPRTHLTLPRTSVLAARGRDVTIEHGSRWPSSITTTGLPADWSDNSSVIESFLALERIQSEAEAVVDPNSMKVLEAMLLDSLPALVEEDVNVIEPGSRSLFGGKDVDFRSTALPEFEHTSELKKSFQGKAYHFWPVDADNGAWAGGEPHADWVLIVIHMDPDNRDSDGSFQTIESMAIVYPRHGTEGRAIEKRVRTRLLEILSKVGIKASPNMLVETPWYPPMNPPQLYNHLSGLHVFWMMKQWLDRTTNLYCSTPKAHQPDRFWDSLPGWFDADQVRIEMIGMAAMSVVRAMRGRCRLAIEPILEENYVSNVDGSRITLENILPSRTRAPAFVPNCVNESGDPLSWKHASDHGDLVSELLLPAKKKQKTLASPRRKSGGVKEQYDIRNSAPATKKEGKEKKGEKKSEKSEGRKERGRARARERGRGMTGDEGAWDEYGTSSEDEEGDEWIEKGDSHGSSHDEEYDPSGKKRASRGAKYKRVKRTQDLEKKAPKQRKSAAVAKRVGEGKGGQKPRAKKMKTK